MIVISLAISPSNINKRPISVMPSCHFCNGSQVLSRVALNQPSCQPAPPTPHAATGSLDIAPLQELHSKIDALRAELAEVKQLLTAERGEVIKEAYTVEEVAKEDGAFRIHDSRGGVQQGADRGSLQGT